MNRIQFFVLTGLSSLILLLLVGHVFLVRQIGIDQAILNNAQQRINQGQAFAGNLQKLGTRIGQDSQRDPALKAILDKNQLKYNPPGDGVTPNEPPAPSPTR